MTPHEQIAQQLAKGPQQVTDLIHATHLGSPTIYNVLYDLQRRGEATVRYGWGGRQDWSKTERR